jgi:adenosylmethionine-8-amino-7-oxononanoate aminotransferase
MSDAARLNRLDQEFVWHPFTQQQGWSEEEPLQIERGEGVYLFDVDGNRYIDGTASLWCNVHGHRHPDLDRAAHEQLDKVAHSTMLGLSHPGATELAARLVEIAPGDLRRVFYSDSGSTAAEIAVKMAFQYHQQRGDTGRTRFIRMREAYHGDTLGSVSVGGIDLFHATYKPLLFDTLAADPGDVDQMEQLLSAHEGEIAAVMMEPLIQGAAGMLVHPDGYLSAVRELCDRHGALLICDEVATGFGRTGTMFAVEQEGVVPDFLCLAKGITGGYLPLAATLTTEAVYDAFLGAPAEAKTFFHGHTYTGNPVACAVALANLDVFERERTVERLQPKIALIRRWLDEVAAMPGVAEVRSRGVMVGVDLGEHDPELRVGHRVTLEARKRGALVRPLGDVVVLMPPLAIDEAELESLLDITARSITATLASLPATEHA